MATRAGSNITTDHDEIQRWAEERGAEPACVRGTGDTGDIGILRLDFPGYTGADSLEHISWDDWFQKFDERGLALLHQNTTARGQKSNFNKLVSRETAEAAESGRNSRRSSGSRTNARSATRSRTQARSSSRSGSSRGSSSSRTKSSGSRSRSASAKRSSGSRSTAGKSAGTRSRATSGKTRGSSSRSNSRSASSRRSGSRSAISRARSSSTARKSASTRSQGNRSRTNKSSRSRSGTASRRNASTPSTRSQSRGSRSAKSRILTDHDEIRRWAEERDAKPTCVIGTGKRGDTGMIRLDFPGYSGAGSLQPIKWNQWFKSFDDNNLALVVQEKTARGQQSNFNKLIGRETAARRAKGSHASRRHPERGRRTEAGKVRSISSGKAGRDQSGSSRGQHSTRRRAA